MSCSKNSKCFFTEKEATSDGKKTTSHIRDKWENSVQFSQAVCVSIKSCNYISKEDVRRIEEIICCKMNRNFMEEQRNLIAMIINSTTSQRGKEHLRFSPFFWLHASTWCLFVFESVSPSANVAVPALCCLSKQSTCSDWALLCRFYKKKD